MRDPRRLVIDLETCSTIDLTNTSSQAYAEHPDTDVICVGWHFAGDPRPVVVGNPGNLPSEVIDHIRSKGVLVAHNRRFEQAVFKSILGPRYGWPVPEDTQWSDTMARGVYHGWPASLEMLAIAMNLPHLKQTQGRRLMLQMSRPRSIDANGKPVWWHKTDPGKLAGLHAYCLGDVAAEEAADQILPELPPRERKIWALDNLSNNRGMRIDLKGVARLGKVVLEELTRLDDEMDITTHGSVTRTTQLKALQGFLSRRGVKADSLDKAHLQDLLSTTRDPAARKAIAIRAEAAKASTAKLIAMQHSVSKDGRARDLFAYYGAGRTGRWAGRRIQPQNLVRGFKHPEEVFDFLSKGGDTEGLRILWADDPLTTISKSLRGCIIADPGHRLVCVDLAQIEARVIAYLARQNDVLDVFRRGEDIYIYAARQQGSSDRQFGKVVVLGCGFGMNGLKFHSTAKAWGVDITVEDAYNAVTKWRQANRKIVAFWNDCETAMRAVLAKRGPRTVNDLTFRMAGDALEVVLPSGRSLFYQDVALDPLEGPTFCAPRGKQWAPTKLYGTLLVQNATQALARDVLAEGMLALRETYRWPAPIGTVHDEIIQEVPEGIAQRCLDRMLSVLCTAPSWAPRLPCHATGYITERYRKD